ncbi:autotransporter domain-containing protein [Aeromonas rivuli]
MSQEKSNTSLAQTGYRLSATALTMAMVLHSGASQADPKGQIIFLGWTADLQHSVWLSAISPGKFDVSSAKTNQPYDVWTQNHKGLHLTVSPEREEWGGTHILYSYANADTSIYDRRFVDSDNQRPDRFTFPNQFTPPTLPPKPTQPGPSAPPEGITPTLPGGVQPPVGTLPPQGITPTLPGGVQPPIATLPPQGITPTLPGGVQPPIATLPPQGITPTLPGGVQPPVGTLPPQGITPTLPGGVQPPVGALPPQGITPTLPGGVQPPVGTLPPQGITPTLPGGVQPPVGTLPPQGITPTLPGGVQPPVGTLPPQGITPTLPGGVQPPVGTLPPQGITPTLPGGVQPPVGTLPPQGITPTLPGGVQPPVGTLPPQGLTPGMPTTPPQGLMPSRPTLGDRPFIIRPGAMQPPIATLPPQGITPTLPGGVQPPVGTLPPQGITPTLPGGVQPPVATLPPQGITPTLPGGVQPPVGTLPPQGGMPTRPPLGERPFITLPGGVQPLPGTLIPEGRLPPPAIPAQPGYLPGQQSAGQQASERALNERTLCVMADERAKLPPEQQAQYPDCPFTRAELAAGQGGQPVAQPESVERRWNLWADEVYYDISDHREGLDMSGSTNVFSLGADTRLDKNTILGFSVSRVDSKVDSFNGGMRMAAGGFNIGPYLAYQVSDSWMLDGTLIYGWMDNKQDLLFLSGDYGSTSLSGSLGATGQYFWSNTSIRPRLAINYSHNRSKGYRMSGDYQGLALHLDNESGSYNQGNMTGTVEFSRVYYTDIGLPLMPYAELGLDYGFERPNDGYILTGDLSSARTEPLSGTMRLGLRTLIGGEATLTTSAGYTSIGQDDLNIWEWRINLSKPF